MIDINTEIVVIPKTRIKDTKDSVSYTISRVCPRLNIFDFILLVPVTFSYDSDGKQSSANDGEIAFIQCKTFQLYVFIKKDAMVPHDHVFLSKNSLEYSSIIPFSKIKLIIINVKNIQIQQRI